MQKLTSLHLPLECHHHAISKIICDQSILSWCLRESKPTILEGCDLSPYHSWVLLSQPLCLIFKHHLSVTHPFSKLVISSFSSYIPQYEGKCTEDECSIRLGISKEIVEVSKVLWEEQCI